MVPKALVGPDIAACKVKDGYTQNLMQKNWFFFFEEELIPMDVDKFIIKDLFLEQTLI